MTKGIASAKQPSNSDRYLPRLQFYVVFTTRVPKSADAFEDLKLQLPAHLDWVAAQEAAGHLFMAGPFRDDTYWEGDGMFILKTPSREAAEQIAETCPFHKAGIRTFKIVPWQFNEGSVTLTIKQSQQSAIWE